MGLQIQLHNIGKDRMTEKDRIKALLEKYCLAPNKALGQNFLVDEDALKNIAALSDPAGRTVLEIGAGPGGLTERLLESAARVIAVEIDRRMAQILCDRFPTDRLTVLQADFLKLGADTLSPLLLPPASIAANLPYYITTPVCTRLMTLGLPVKSMALMVQSDAAERFFAHPGDRVYGPLTVITNYLYTPRREFTLTPASFYPAPEINSTVVSFDRRDTPYIPALYGLVNSAFSMRRKTLLNNLKPLGFDAELIERAGLSPSVRAEALEADDFLRLCALIPDKETLK